MEITLTDKFISGCDIDLSNKKLGIIHQPKIKELIEKDIKISDITTLFSLIEHSYSKLSRDTFIEKLPSKFILALTIDKINENKTNHINNLFIALSILYEVDINNIIIDSFDNEIAILIKDKNVLINEDNFDIFLDVVLNMFKIDKNELHKPLKKEDEWVELSGTQREKDMIEFFKKRKKEREEKEKLYLNDYINIVVHIGKYTYDYVISLTYWQLMNSLKSLQIIEKYKEMLGYTWSYKFDVKSEDNPHWIKEIKLEQDTIEL